MNDEQWQKFRELGGADWLRRFIDAKPSNYHDLFKRATIPVRGAKNVPKSKAS